MTEHKCPPWCDIAITHHHVNIPPDVPKLVVPTQRYLHMRHALQAVVDANAFKMLPHSVQDRIRMALE